MAAYQENCPKSPDSTVADEVPEYSIDNSRSSDLRIVLCLKRRIRSPSPPVLEPYDGGSRPVKHRRRPPKLTPQISVKQEI